MLPDRQCRTLIEETPWRSCNRVFESAEKGIYLALLKATKLHQEKNGKWDIVDGLQRLSTIFQFFGILKNEDGTLRPKLILQKTK